MQKGRLQSRHSLETSVRLSIKSALFLIGLVFVGVCAAKDQIVTTDDGVLQLTIRRLLLNPIKHSPPNEPPTAEELRKKYVASYAIYLRNSGKEDVTVPIYPSNDEARVTSRGHGKETIDFRFLLERQGNTIFITSAYHFVTLRPGEATWLPSYSVTTDGVASLPEYIFSYQVEAAFGKRYGCWSGTLKVVSENKEAVK